MKRVFIGGVMQGSIQGKGILSQDYRAQIREVLLERWPELEVVDPFSLHPNSVDYGDDGAKKTLFAMIDLAKDSDLVIAYVPVASMGTAMEMYAAYQHNVPVISISPLAENWVVRALSRTVFPDMDSFLESVRQADSLEMVG
jgi:hypothetical protein